MSEEAKPKMFFTFQIVKEDGSTWAIGKIYGGTQDLSAYYLCFVRLKNVDEEWAVDEGKARILFLENRKGAPMQKQLQQVLFEKCALVDGDDITFVFDLLVTDAQRAAFVEEVNKAVGDHLESLGKFATSPQPKSDERDRIPPDRLTL